MKTSILISIFCIAVVLLVSCGKKPADSSVLAPLEQKQAAPAANALDDMPVTADSLQLENDTTSVEL